MTTVLLDTHVIQWWSAEPDRLSQDATSALEEADELAVASISWFELAWLAQHDRIRVGIPIRTWVSDLSERVRTGGTTTPIAATAVALPTSFPGDPADRIIYATAVEHDWMLVTKDGRLRGHDHPRPITIW